MWTFVYFRGAEFATLCLEEGGFSRLPSPLVRSLTSGSAAMRCSAFLLFTLSLVVAATRVATGQFPNAIANGGAFPNTTRQAPPTGMLYPNAAGVLTPRAQYRSYLYALGRYYRQRAFDSSVGPAWAYIMAQIDWGSYLPIRAENGDWLGQDNDLDGVVEPVYVRGQYRDGEYVRGHYRALPGYGSGVSQPAYRSGF